MYSLLTVDFFYLGVHLASISICHAIQGLDNLLADGLDFMELMYVFYYPKLSYTSKCPV